jgi:hypothetical protein
MMRVRNAYEVMETPDQHTWLVKHLTENHSGLQKT